MKPRIAITCGDPAGIGPEIVVKALRDPRIHRACRPFLIGAPMRVPMGRPSRQAGMAAIGALRRGLLLIQMGQAEALVTAPVSKESFRLADHGFPGHTEWLAAQCKAPNAAMLMVAGPLRALLMTRHIPLADVPKHLTSKVVELSARLAHEFLRDVIPRGRKRGIHRGSRLTIRRDDEPRIVLCGVNPHAGDHGIIGTEEQGIFTPAIRALRRTGLRISGPVPADTVFHHMAQGRYDLALAAYHDQGMIPLKLHAPDQLVNITLGLPLIRTSPGHGTAYDIAGKNRARPGPMIEAILLAAKYSRARGQGGKGAGEL